MSSILLESTKFKHAVETTVESILALGPIFLSTILGGLIMVPFVGVVVGSEYKIFRGKPRETSLDFESDRPGVEDLEELKQRNYVRAKARSVATAWLLTLSSGRCPQKSSKMTYFCPS